MVPTTGTPKLGLQSWSWPTCQARFVTQKLVVDKLQPHICFHKLGTTNFPFQTWPLQKVPQNLYDRAKSPNRDCHKNSNQMLSAPTYIQKFNVLHLPTKTCEQKHPPQNLHPENVCLKLPHFVSHYEYVRPNIYKMKLSLFNLQTKHCSRNVRLHLLSSKFCEHDFGMCHVACCVWCCHFGSLTCTNRCFWSQSFAWQCRDTMTWKTMFGKQSCECKLCWSSVRSTVFDERSLHGEFWNCVM